MGRQVPFMHLLASAGRGDLSGTTGDNSTPGRAHPHASRGEKKTTANIYWHLSDFLHNKITYFLVS